MFAFSCRGSKPKSSKIIWYFVFLAKPVDLQVGVFGNSNKDGLINHIDFLCVAHEARHMLKHKTNRNRGINASKVIREPN